MSVIIQPIEEKELENIPGHIKQKIEDTASKLAFNTNRKQIKIFLLSTLAKYYILDQMYKSLLEQKEQSNG